MILIAFSTSLVSASNYKTVKLYFNDITVKVNGQEKSLYDASGKFAEPFIYEDTTYVPLRAVSNYLKKDVDWDAGTQTVSITNQKTAALEGFRNRWYHDLLTNVGLTDLTENKSAIIEEYRATIDTSFWGVSYFIVRKFSNRSYKLILKRYSSEFVDEGEIIYDKSVSLTKDQFDSIVKLVEENYFWDIPSADPNTAMGCDGTTYFLEGFYNDQYNVTTMWEPNDSYPIYRIADGIKKLANSLGLDDTQAAYDYYSNH